MRAGIRHLTQTPLGPMQLWVTPDGLAGAWFEDQAHAPDFAALGPFGHHPWLLRTEAWLAAYFDAQAAPIEAFPADIPLDLSAGTPFQQGVWQALRAIAPGATTRYGAIAEQLGKPQAQRAVGAAVGRNPISIIVPCHRVLGADGALTGYAGGLSRKLDLLRREGAMH